MKTINHLQTKEASRYSDNDPEREGNKNTKFADFIIDERSLYQMLKKYDMVPCLGWGNLEYQKQLIKFFLLQQIHPNLYYRYPILVCPWCGDEECGFVSVIIEREEEVIVWKDFKLEPDNKPINIGPFYFIWEKYERAIKTTLGLSGE